MKKLILPLLLMSSLAWSQDTGFCPVPFFPNIFNYWQQNPIPVEFIKVEKQDYKRNKNASFCTRPIEMVDTIVFHHSETPSTSTPEYINQLHLNRGTKDDPWYMIAYSFVINAPYKGATIPKQVVTEGRPLEIVGAHAGSNAFVPMDDEQQRLWAEGKVACGKEGEDFKVDPTLVKNGKIKANVTTLGVVVNGNYAPFSKHNPNGYRRGASRGPTTETKTMLAQLSCQLQKQYPRIKNLRPHNSYHSTTCPGDLWTPANVAEVKKIAKGLGCEFN